MTTQPIPDVSVSDVERVARRDFDSALVDDVLAILAEYGEESRDRKTARVRLAVLKLADGCIERLRQQTDEAKLDFRDVIAPAEYPGYSRSWQEIRQLSPDDRQRIIDADWRQYQAWLSGRETR